MCGRGGEQGHGAFGQVAALAGLPFVMGLDEHRPGQPQQGLWVGEDPDDVGAALDLLVQPSAEPFGVGGLPRGQACGEVVQLAAGESSGPITPIGAAAYITDLGCTADQIAGRAFVGLPESAA